MSNSKDGKVFGAKRADALPCLSVVATSLDVSHHLVALQFFNQHLGKDHVCQRNLSQTKLVSTQEKNGLGKRE